MQATVLLALMVFAIPAWSYFVGATDVGGVDTIIGEEALGNSGYADELAFIQTYIPDVTSYSLIGFNFQPVYSDLANQNIVQNVWATLLPNESAWYFIKFGNLKLTPENYDTFLYENVSAYNYAVINLSDIADLGGDLSDINIGKVSHIGIPEPTTLILLGSGLFGLALVGRRKKFRK